MSAQTQRFKLLDQTVSGASDTRLIPMEYAVFTFNPPILRDAGGNKVTPTGGTFLVQGSATLPPDEVWQTMDSGLFNAVDAYDPDRPQPNGYGDIAAYRVVATGVTGGVTVDYCGFGRILR